MPPLTYISAFRRTDATAAAALHLLPQLRGRSAASENSAMLLRNDNVSRRWALISLRLYIFLQLRV